MKELSDFLIEISRLYTPAFDINNELTHTHLIKNEVTLNYKAHVTKRETGLVGRVTPDQCQ